MDIEEFLRAEINIGRDIVYKAHPGPLVATFYTPRKGKEGKPIPYIHLLQHALYYLDEAEGSVTTNDSQSALMEFSIARGLLQSVGMWMEVELFNQVKVPKSNVVDIDAHRFRVKTAKPT